MNAITSKLAAIACTIVLSTTVLIGAVGPATAVGTHNPAIARTVA